MDEWTEDDCYDDYNVFEERRLDLDREYDDEEDEDEEFDDFEPACLVERGPAWETYWVY